MPRDLTRDEHGTITSEYVILMVCILVIAIAGWRTFGETIVRLISGD
jgi:Flp pilus assembly pilin Flp